MNAKLKTKSALSYFGSDSEVAERLAAMLNHCRHVTVPFVGGASILPHLTARAIVANDKHRAAINFYRHLSNLATRPELIGLCQKTLSHPAELDDALAINATDNKTVLGAWAFWALCWIARKGKGGTRSQKRAGMPSVRRTAVGGTNASRIRAAADDLDAWAKHFERCEWECRDFRDLLPRVADDASCGVYCDPPWVGAGDDYQHPFGESDHRDLAECLSRFEHTTVVVRYGDAELIRELYPAPRWRIIEASARTQTNARLRELWITNRCTEGESN